MSRPSNKRAWAAVNNRLPRVCQVFEFIIFKISCVEKCVSGVPVLVLENGDAPTITKVEQALQLIAQYDPTRLKRLPGDLRSGVQATEISGRTGWFDADTWTCHLSVSYLESDVSVEQIAMTIVHEATHARLRRNGFEYDVDLRYRVELICIRRELAFAKLLPNSDELIADCEETLDWLVPEYLSDEGFAQRARAERLRSLRMMLDMGVRPWLIRVMLAVVATLTGRFWRKMFLSFKEYLRPNSEAAS